jgi:hypothetical protein
MTPAIDSYRLLLAAQVAMNEQGAGPSHPVNSTINNPTLRNTDNHVLNYFCEIDTPNCAGGDNHPIR